MQSQISVQSTLYFRMAGPCAASQAVVTPCVIPIRIFTKVRRFGSHQVHPANPGHLFLTLDSSMTITALSCTASCSNAPTDKVCMSSLHVWVTFCTLTESLRLIIHCNVQGCSKHTQQASSDGNSSRPRQPQRGLSGGRGPEGSTVGADARTESLAGRQRLHAQPSGGGV